MTDRANIVPGWIDQRSADRADHPAIIDGDGALTYAQLRQRAAAIAEGLAALGLQPGDRIALLLRNATDFATLLHASMRAGLVVVPLDPRLAESELRERIRCARAAMLVHAGDERGRGAVRDTGCTEIQLAEIALATEPRLTPIQHDLSAPHSILFTSGSSGAAKGVVLSYGNYLWSAVGSAFRLGLSPQDRWLACLPFCHVGGLSILLRSVLYGTTAVIHERFDPERVDRAIDEQRVTLVSVVPIMLRRMLAARGHKAYPPWLRCVLVGGAPLPSDLLEECRARGVPIAPTYGLTEAASQIATLAPGEAERKSGSAGPPLPGGEIRLMSAGRPVANGEVGEIQIRGPMVTACYAGDPRPAGDANGWLATRDLGRFDEDGYLYVLGRADDVIISGGENIHPLEVENALQSHPAVAEACVAGVSDPQWGSAVAAWVCLESGATASEDELRAHVRRSLAGFKVPRRIAFVDDFPRTAAGKIARRKVALPPLEKGD